MRKLFALSVLLAGVVFMAGCIQTRSDVSGWITLTKSSGHVGDSAAKATKVGTSEAKGIILVAFDDSSIDKACKSVEPRITKIHHVDYETINILGIYGAVKTVVYGE